MQLCERQRELLGALQSAAAGSETGEVAYHAEWLGYLPFGMYHWIKVDGREVARDLPLDWTLADLEALVAAGQLISMREWVDPGDEFHRQIIYRLGRAPGDHEPEA